MLRTIKQGTWLDCYPCVQFYKKYIDILQSYSLINNGNEFYFKDEYKDNTKSLQLSIMQYSNCAILIFMRDDSNNNHYNEEFISVDYKKVHKIVKRELDIITYDDETTPSDVSWLDIDYRKNRRSRNDKLRTCKDGN